MNPLIQSNKSTPLFVIAVLLACFALLPTVRGVMPPPDGGYLHGVTAEGEDALFNLSPNPVFSQDSTAIGFHALFSSVSSFFDTAVGSQALASSTGGEANTAVGYKALTGNTGGAFNTAVGQQALASNTTAFANTAIGTGALFGNTTGEENTASGADALVNNTTGGFNIAIGSSAGSNLTTGSNNIDISNAGVAGEGRTIRIGTTGTQRKTFIAGIAGVTVPEGVGVIVGTNGKLGTVVSSARFKDKVKPIDKESEAILALKPVTFRYKKELDPDGIPQFGLVAEEVEKVNPDLVARDEEGKAYTVRYEAVNAMLLNEFLKEHRKVQEHNSKIQQQEATITELKSMVAEQQKGLQAVTACLKQQAAQIQKVSAQLEVSKPASPVVNNNQ